MKPRRWFPRSVWALLLLASQAAVAEPTATLVSGPLLSIDEAIRLALDNNQDIKVEAYAPQIARANVLSAYGQFDPALNFGRSYSRSFGYPAFPGPLAPTLAETDSYDLNLKGLLPTGLTYTIGGNATNERGFYNSFTPDYLTFGGVNLTQPLLRGFGFGANLVNIRVARANRSISEWQYRQTLINTVTNVIVTYHQLVLAHDDLRIALRSRELAATLVTEDLQLLKAGKGTEIDLVTARAEVAKFESGIIEAENQVRTTDNQLRQLLGEKSFPGDQPLLNVASAPVPPVTVDPARDFQAALDHRPDYQQARLGITVNQANAAAARNGLLPQVNLVASYGYNGLAGTFAASREMLAQHDAPSSSIGLNFSIPITNSLARGQARAARLTLAQSEAALRDLEGQIALAVANAASQIEIAHRRVLADQAAYELSNQALGGEEKGLKLGYVSTQFVIQAQESLEGVEASLADDRYAERQAVAAYDQQLGMTLLRNHITLAEDK
jgi:outer membrane protein TolC